MFDYIDVVERLLKGEFAEAEIEGRKRLVRFMNPELGLINISDPIPVHVSAFGPRGRRMVAERGYSGTNSVGSPERAEAAIGEMKRVWAEAGRDVADLTANANCGGAVLRRSGDWDADYVRDQAGPSAAISLHDLAESGRVRLSRRAPAARARKVCATNTSRFTAATNRKKPATCRTTRII